MKLSYKISIAVAILIVVVGVVWYFLKGTSSPPPSSLPEGGEVALPESPSATSSPSTTGEGDGISALIPLSESPVFSFWVSPAGEVYYLTTEGQVYAAREGPDLEISRQVIEALNSVTVSPSRQLILAAFGDPLNPSWGIFDAVDGVWRPLPQTIRSVTWGADDQTLFGTVQNGAQTSFARITRANDAFTITELIRGFALYDTRLTFVPPQNLFFAELPSASHQSGVWKLDTQTLSLNLALSPAAGRVIQWTSQGEIALISEGRQRFVMRDPLTLEEKAPVPFFTLPEKCGAYGDVLYCFIPQNSNDAVALPDDYLSRAWYSLDILFALDLRTGELRQHPIAAPYNSTLDGIRPRVLDGSLYFINRYNNTLYRMVL